MLSESVTPYAFGWLIGILEGEAYFGWDNNTQRIALEMTDEDTMIRAASICERLLGVKITIRSRQPLGNRNETYTFLLCGANAREMMKRVVPYFSKRRRGQIWRSLNKYRVPKHLDERSKDTLDNLVVLSTARV